MKTLKEFVSQSNGVINSDVMLPPDTIGIPRAFMPQIPANSYKNFLTYLLDNGAVLEDIPECSIGMIKLTQADIDLRKVREMIDRLDGLGTGEVENSFIISSDYRILDGHHRFLALVFKGDVTTVPVVRVSFPIRTLIALGHKFGDKQEPVQESTSLTDFEIDQFRSLRKSYRTMKFYMARDKNLFKESLNNWRQEIQTVTKIFDPIDSQKLISMAMRSIDFTGVLPK